MSRHVSPERWADLAAGRLAPRERARIEEHARSCASCAAARRRVDGVRGTLGAVRDSMPSISTSDVLGAQVYWSASSELRRRERDERRRRRWIGRALPFVGVGVALAAAVTAVFVVHSGRSSTSTSTITSTTTSTVGSTSTSLSTSTSPSTSTSTGTVANLVTLVQGDVNVGAEESLGAGTIIRTGVGRVAVQFGERSGMIVEPRSMVQVIAFDAGAIVIRVSGAAGFELERRAAGQRFAVLAGTRTVEVRGTSFRVAENAGDLDVAVRRGRVAVMEGEAGVEVGEGARLALGRGLAIGAVMPRPLLRAAAEELAVSLRVPMVSGWSLGAAGLRSSTALLAVSSAPGARVRVDGVEIGRGPFRLRTAPGRHLVETGGAARWVDVAPGAATEITLSGPSRSERPAQVDAQLIKHRAAVGHCAEAERKVAPGFSGRVELEIGIGPDGSVNFVAPVRRSTHEDAERCILNLVRDRFVFPGGSPATVRKVITF